MSKILVTDDDSMMLRMAAFILKKAGHEVLTAASGQEALSLIRSAQPDLLFLDIEMPEQNGLEVLTALRAQSETAALPVCLMSGTVTDELRSQADALRAVGIIAKPLQADEMQRIAASVRTEG